MSEVDGQQLTALVAAFSLKTLPHSEVELTGDIPYETLLPYRAEALKQIVAHMELPGFRKGHVPERTVLQRVGEMAVLEEAVDHFVRKFYPVLVVDKKIDAVGRPDIRITKLAPKNPASLTIRTAVYPEVKVPDNFQKIAAGVPATVAEPVSEEEFSKALEQLQKSRPSSKAGLATGQAHEESLPELNDEFAKSVGAFESLDQLKEKLREGIAEEKKRDARDKRRSTIIEALLEKTSVDMPQIFVESEIEKMLSQMKGDVTRFGLEFEEYLKRIEKTEEALREEMKGSAEKRAKMQLMLNELANKEKIVPTPDDVEREFAHALEHYPEADKEGLRIHIETILRNEKVLAMLESATT